MEIVELTNAGKDEQGNDLAGTAAQPVVVPAPTGHETQEQLTATAADAPKHAPTVEEVKARRLASAPTPPPKVETTQKPAETTKTEVSKEISLPADALAKIAQLQSEKLDLEAKAKSAETTSAAAKKLEDAMALAKAGKHLAAIEALGIDITAANLELLGSPADTEEAKREADRNAAIEAARAETEALKKRLDAREQTEAEREAAEGRDATHEYVKANVKDFAFLSRSEKWVDRALENARELGKQATEKLKRELNEDERDKVVVFALKEAEKEHAEEAKLYGLSVDQRNGNSAASSSTETPSSSRPTIDSTLRGSVTGTPQPRRKLTFEEAKQRRREQSYR